MAPVALTAPTRSSFTPAKISLFAGQCGLIAMGSYYAQLLELSIAGELRLAPHFAGLMVTFSQIGYVAGLLLIAPPWRSPGKPSPHFGGARRLAPLPPERRLIAERVVLLAASFGIGMFSVAVQMLVASASAATTESARGSVVGWVTGGLLVGILAAWPVANVAGDLIGWRGLYFVQAAAIASSALVMARILPTRLPQGSASYGVLVTTFWQPFAALSELRRRALIQAALFGSFSLFWTAAPLKLAQYDLGRTEVALFGLIGGVGALVAPMAGRAADRGRDRLIALGGMFAIAAGFAISAAVDTPQALCACAILLGAGVQANLVASQRRILSLDERAGHRLNGLFVAFFFLGGAAGSAAAGPLMTLGGWVAIPLAGMACTLIAAVLAGRTSPA